MNLPFEPMHKLDNMEVQVLSGNARWVFPLSGVKSFIEIPKIHALPPPAAWDGIVMAEGLTCCARILRKSPETPVAAFPLKGCLIERGKIPVMLVFERFVTGAAGAGFEPVNAATTPFPGVTGRKIDQGMVCYHIDTGKLMV